MIMIYTYSVVMGAQLVKHEDIPRRCNISEH